MSTDNTFQLASDITKDTDFVQIYQEKDNGIYDAMNKAMLKSKGEYIFYLNSDDYILSNFFGKEMLNCFHRNFDYIIGDVVFFKRPSRKVKRLWLTNLREKNIFLNLFYSPYPPHPGFICKSKYIKELGFETKYQIAADYMQMQRIILNNSLVPGLINKPITAMAMGGNSNQISGIKKAHKEVKQINRVLNIKEFILFRYFRNIIQHILPIFLNFKL